MVVSEHVFVFVDSASDLPFVFRYVHFVPKRTLCAWSSISGLPFYHPFDCMEKSGGEKLPVIKKGEVTKTKKEDYSDKVWLKDNSDKKVRLNDIPVWEEDRNKQAWAKCRWPKCGIDMVHKGAWTVCKTHKAKIKSCQEWEQEVDEEQKLYEVEWEKQHNRQDEENEDCDPHDLEDV